MEKYLMEDSRRVLFPKTISELVLPESELLLTKTLISELRVIAIVAKSVDAIMLLRIVCTARTPFFNGS